MQPLLPVLVLVFLAMSKPHGTQLASAKVEACSGPVVAIAHDAIPDLESLEFKTFVHSGANNDDPDGCCIQWVPGQAKGCSQTKQKQCKEDADAVNAKWSWHAGACTDADGCH